MALDRHRIDRFLDRFTEIAAGATTIGLLAVADRCGLSLYLGQHGGGTAAEIAAGAGLNERYVTEILSGLAAAGVVDYEATTRRFELPPEHALFVSDDASPYFMGGWLDMIPATMAQIPGIAEAAVRGGGVEFDEFGAEMIRGLDRGNGPSQRAFLIRKWLPDVPGLMERLDLGIRVADVGCGSGTAVILMAKAYPNSSIVGFDISSDSIDTARERARGLANTEFHKRGVAEIATDPPFGLVTSFDVIHALVDPLGGLRRIREALAPDGVYLMMEPAASSNLEENLSPQGALLYGVSLMHCMTQSLARGGQGLGAAWGRQLAEEYCRAAGFTGFDFLEGISNRFSSFYLVTP